jgi:CheY-like chemotaxis protein
MLAASGRGYRVLMANDGLQALRMLRDHRPDAILLDLVMPEWDGFWLLEKKNEDQELMDIPVVVISARDPAGQPIVCNALTVTQRDGMSASQLLTCINMVCSNLSAIARGDDPAQTGEHRG